MRASMPKYSIVVPLHNEQENVTDLYDRLKAVMEAHGETFEIVLVDDGSSDHTFAMLREIAAVDSRVTVVKLRRNFGQTAGLAAGFDHARGEYIIAMDGDLQHDPSDIPLFLEKIAAGYDIVSGWRKVRVDNFWMRRIPSRIANWMMAKISGVDIHDFGTTFKAYRRDILEQVPLYGELHRFIPALASWHGATICEVPIRNVNRERGVSHYGITRTFRVFFDLLTIRFLLKYLSRPKRRAQRLGITTWRQPLRLSSRMQVRRGISTLPVNPFCVCLATPQPQHEMRPGFNAACQLPVTGNPMGRRYNAPFALLRS